MPSGERNTEKRENVLDEKRVVEKVTTNETDSEQIFLLGEKDAGGGYVLWEMDHGAPLFFFFIYI